MTKIIMTRKYSKFDEMTDVIASVPMVVKKGIPLAIMLCGYSYYPDDVSTPAPIIATPVIEHEQNEELKDTVSHTVTKSIDLRSLNQKTKAGGLLGAYIGIKGALPDDAEINFSHNLDKLWKQKLKINNVSGATTKNATKIISDYNNNDPEFKNVREFVANIDEQIGLVKNNLNWDKYCNHVKLSIKKCETLQLVMNKFEGRHITAYGMTEVMPTRNGEINYIVLDTLLRNAGESFVNSIPALGDVYLSKGFYQFTSFAIRHDNKFIEGASIVNLYLDAEYKIGSSVVTLTNEQQHRAAFMFALYNMSRLFKKLSDKDLPSIDSGKCNMEQMTQFVATAHHLPAVAIKNAKKWIKGKCIKSYRVYSGPKLDIYAEKTESNLNEVTKKGH